MDWNKSGLESYETLWSRDASRLQDVELPTSFTAGNLILAIGNSVKTLVGRVETIFKRVEVTDKWVEEVVDTTNLRVSEMEHNIGEANFSEYAGTSLWNSISLLSNGLKTVEEQGDAIEAVERDIKAVIKLHYQGDLAVMATKMLDVSISFIGHFIQWVDDTQSVLVAGGNQTSDVWWILTRVMRAIFEDYFAPAHATPTRTRYRGHNHQASVILWGTIKTHVAAVSINDRGIKDHPIVVGAYAQWLVSHSGRREAGEVLLNKEAAKAIAIAAELKVSIGSQKGLLAELKTRVEAVKKVADKALAKSG